MRYRSRFVSVLATGALALVPGISHASWVGALADLLKGLSKADETSAAARTMDTDVVVGGVRLGAAAKKLSEECAVAPDQSRAECEQRARYFQECHESGSEYSKCRDLYFHNVVGNK